LYLGSGLLRGRPLAAGFACAIAVRPTSAKISVRSSRTWADWQDELAKQTGNQQAVIAALPEALTTDLC
jgi:hypothetical protein